MPKSAKPVRKVLTAVMTPDHRDADGEVYYGTLVVVCDDGMAFSYDWREGRWQEYAPVPGTQAALDAGEE